MPTITTVIEIAAPPQAVFGFLVDPANWMKFASGLVDAQPRHLLAGGSKGIWTRKQAGQTTDYHFEVVEFVPGSRLVLSVSASGITARDEMTLEEAPGGTKATFTETLTPTAFPMRVMLFFFTGLIRWTLRRDYGRLKMLLERGG